MNFFKDLTDDIDTKEDGLEVDDNQMVDTLSEDINDSADLNDNIDGLDEFDLSNITSPDVDEDMIKKMEMKEASDSEPVESDEASDTAQTSTTVFSGVDNADDNIDLENNVVKGQLGADTVTVQKNTENSDVKEATNVTTVISKGTVINGSIVSDGSLEILGTVNGDISCLGKLSISGSVKGKSSASEVYLNTDRLNGGITSKGCVKIGEGTVVIGDVTASSCVIAGAVKGDLDVNGPVIVDATAVVKGNINSKGIQVNNGAVIDGFCSLPYASVDIDSYFGDED